MTVSEKEIKSPELLAYQKEKLAAYEAANAKEADGSIVFAGDSIIEFFPLKKYLGHDFRLINRGIAGTDTAWLLEHIGRQVCELQPRQLFLQIGTNDLGQGLTVKETAERILEIIAQVRRESVATEIYLLSVLPVNESESCKVRVKARKNSDIIKLNQALQILGGAEFIDLYPLLLDASGGLSGTYTTDGLHLTQAAYAKLAEHLKLYLAQPQKS